GARYSRLHQRLPRDAAIRRRVASGQSEIWIRAPFFGRGASGRTSPNRISGGAGLARCRAWQNGDPATIGPSCRRSSDGQSTRFVSEGSGVRLPASALLEIRSLAGAMPASYVLSV